MRVHILLQARADLAAARDFYARSGIEEYFAVTIASDLDSLCLMAGTHRTSGGYYRALAKRFPFGIFYRIEEDIVRVYAVLDLRRDPAWIRRRLRDSGG